jgi:hypothetical protein
MSNEFNYTREWTDAEAFPLLSFTRNWENPADYPTYEPDETQVRKDMQSLHDEVKDYLNQKLIPAVLAEDATENARIAAEEARAAAEKDRVIAENNRVIAEEARDRAEQNRAGAETQRALAETARIDGERLRDAAEQGRVLAEDSRAYEEQQRAEFERARYDAERERIDAEFGRSTAEEARVEAEQARAIAEQARVEAELARENAVSVSEERLQALEKNVADLMYEPITITSFKCSPSVAERGEKAVTGGVETLLSWTLNKKPERLRLNGTVLDSESLGSFGKVRVDTTWTLEATDDRGATDSKTTSITFVNAAYYGAAELSGPMGSAFILSLTKKLTDTRKRTITADAAAGQHIWYAVPVRLGACTFKVGGFAGGFDLVATVDFTNIYGYTEPYYIYRSSQTGLGETTVEVS